MYPVPIVILASLDDAIGSAYDPKLSAQREAGRAAYARKDWGATIRILLPLGAKLPKDAELFNTLANAYFFLAQTPNNPDQEMQFEAALTQYRAALAVEPKNAVYFGNIGNLWRTRAVGDPNPPTRRDKWQAAATAYESSVTLVRGNRVDLNYLGMSYFALGRFADAEKAHREANAARPDHPDAGIWFNIGDDCVGQKKWPEAERAYRESVKLAPSAIKFAPTVARFRNSLGLALFRQNKFADAEAEFRQALALDPKAPAHAANVEAAQQAQQKTSDR